MLDFDEGLTAHEKSYITIGQLPEVDNPQQPQTKKAPFSIIANHAFVHSVGDSCTFVSENFFWYCPLKDLLVLM